MTTLRWSARTCGVATSVLVPRSAARCAIATLPTVSCGPSSMPGSTCVWISIIASTVDRGSSAYPPGRSPFFAQALLPFGRHSRGIGSCGGPIISARDLSTLPPGADLQIEPTTQPIAPVRPEGALGPYTRALRSHRLLVLAITLLALAAAIGWLAHRSAQYEAKAEILVSPLPQDDQTFLGIPDILRDSPSDPTRTIQTAATFVDSPLAAQVAARKVDHGYTLDSVQGAVTVQPQ